MQSTEIIMKRENKTVKKLLAFVVGFVVYFLPPLLFKYLFTLSVLETIWLCIGWIPAILAVAYLDEDIK